MCVRRGWFKPKKKTSPREFRLTLLLASTAVTYDQYRAIMLEAMSQ